MLNANKGTYFTMGDNEGVEMKFAAGQCTSYTVTKNIHTPVTKAHYRGIATLGAEAVSYSGGPVVGSGVGAITSFVNRPTNRDIEPPKSK